MPPSNPPSRGNFRPPSRSGSTDIKKKMETAWDAIMKKTPRGSDPAIPKPTQRALYQAALWLHSELTKKQVQYYFVGGFACINVGMTARTTADIDIAVPNGAVGYGTLLDLFASGPFTKHGDNYYFYVAQTGAFVEVDGIIAGWQAFPELTKARLIKVGNPANPEMQLTFLEPAGLLRLKLSSWANETRRNSPKRAGDMSDMQSIRDLLVSEAQGTKKKIDFYKTLDPQMKKGLKDWIAEFKDGDRWSMLDPSIR
ncbi:hypothetical protein DHEL01_v200331 [Diaporthe helianthi]|uniref:Uncharacterized protein n=1 Tax=Diaporthe helianthi TaxID=158607 RepID=A0A2P5IFJ9_DIAHE|nr:hypothetical protein DHEL01_v200331 [Diaporthe helianthi]